MCCRFSPSSPRDTQRIVTDLTPQSCRSMTMTVGESEQAANDIVLQESHDMMQEIQPPTDTMISKTTEDFHVAIVGKHAPCDE